jgi:glycosyltransferase involved in cell wall biosynthesis
MIAIAISAALLALSVAALIKIVKISHRHRYVPARARTIAPDKMPSVSVCIPARNEEHAMARCLDAVIASDYPKLEIIVIDDNSVDNTSALVRSYANDGVRFVKSDDLPKGWIGRNYAYESLRERASGKYILFLSVDTHIGPEAVSHLVAYLMHKRVEMVSLLPSRMDNYRLSVLFAPLRHLQELLFSSKNNPAAISGGWLVNRELLGEHFGDLSDLKDDILIEQHIAKKFASSESGYDFIINAHACDVSFEKRWSSQVEASIRSYALATDKSLVKSVATLLALLAVSLAPFYVVLSFGLGWYAAALIAVLAELALMAMFTYYASLIWSRGTALAWLCWPVVAIQELLVFIVAAIKRKKGTVTWKGRPVFSK